MSKRHEGISFSVETVGVRDEASLLIGRIEGRFKHNTGKVIYAFDANSCSYHLNAGELRAIADKLDELNGELST